MFEFILSFQFLVGLGVGAVAGGFVGVGLGRRSSKANEFYDRARAGWDLKRAELEEEVRELKARIKGK
jgi:hypothetical protein